VASLFHGAGHNIDHHHLGRTLHLEQLAFAWACVHRRIPHSSLTGLASIGLTVAIGANDGG